MAAKPPDTTATGSPRRRGSGLLVIALTGLGFLILGASAFLLSYNGIHQVAELGARDRDLTGIPLTHLYPAMYTVLLLLAFAGSYVLRDAWWPRRVFIDALIVLLIVLGATASVLYSLDLRLDGPSTTAVLAAIPLPAAALGFYLWRAISAHLRDQPRADDRDAAPPADADEAPATVTVRLSELTGAAPLVRPEEPALPAETKRVRRAGRPEPTPAPEPEPATTPTPEPARADEPAADSVGTASAGAPPAEDTEPTKATEPTRPTDDAEPADTTPAEAAGQADTAPTEPLAPGAEPPSPKSAEAEPDTTDTTTLAASAASAPVTSPEVPTDTAGTASTEATAAKEDEATETPATTAPTPGTDKPTAPLERAEPAEPVEPAAGGPEPAEDGALPKRTPRGSDIARKARSLAERPAVAPEASDTGHEEPEADTGTVWIDDAFVPDIPSDDPTSDEALPADGPDEADGDTTTVPTSFADISELRRRPMVRRPRRGGAVDVPTDPPSGRVRSEPVPPQPPQE